MSGAIAPDKQMHGFIEALWELFREPNKDAFSKLMAMAIFMVQLGLKTPSNLMASFMVQLMSMASFMVQL